MDTHEELKARALDLRQMLDYSRGAVVSKTLIDKPVGTLTLFAFDDGEGLSEHTAPFDATVQILEGAADLTIGANVVRATEGQLVIMPARVPHAVRAVGRFKMMLIMIRA